MHWKFWKKKSMPPDQWQKYWHECFDKDPPKENDGEWSEPLPEIGSDYRLLCGFSWVTPETRKKVLSVMPKGEEIYLRIEDYLQRRHSPIDESAATALLSKSIVLIKNCVETDLTEQREFEIVSEQGVPLRDAIFNRDGPVSIDLDDELSNLVEAASGKEALSAYFFLNELFYWQGNDYLASNYSLWPLCSNGEENPYAPLLDLFDGGWSAGWNGKEVFLYDRRLELCGRI